MAMHDHSHVADTWEMQTFGAASEGQRQALLAFGYDGCPVPWSHLTKAQAATLLRRYEQVKRALWQTDDDQSAREGSPAPETTPPPHDKQGKLL